MRRLAVTCVLLAGIATQALAASDVDATYDVSWAGIKIATARVTGSLDGAAYKLNIQSQYGIFFYSGTINGAVVGRVEGDRIQPKSYTLSATGDPDQRSAIEFEGTVARKIVIEPPLPPTWNEGRIPLEPKHRADAIDPISALVLASLRAGGDGAQACRTTLPVFSGVSRFDVVFSPTEAPRTRRAQSPPAATGIVCSAKFIPIAGHRPANKTVQAVAKSNGLRIEFEPAASGAVRLPRRMDIPTRYGSVVIERAERTASN